MARKDRKAFDQGLDSVLPPAGLDLMGDIIASDRRRTGRAGEAPSPEEPDEKEAEQNYDNKTGQQDIKHYDNKTTGQDHNATVTQEDNKTGEQSFTGSRPPRTQSRRRDPRPPKPDSVPAEPADLLTLRIAEAQRMAKSATMTVTLRIPQEMNNWLDEYVHRAWPARIRKQELVVEALRLLVARRGKAGEPVLPTELLPEEP
jgi:hypothetical protein